MRGERSGLVLAAVLVSAALLPAAAQEVRPSPYLQAARAPAAVVRLGRGSASITHRGQPRPVPASDRASLYPGDVVETHGPVNLLFSGGAVVRPRGKAVLEILEPDTVKRFGSRVLCRIRSGAVETSNLKPGFALLKPDGVLITK